MCVSRQVKLHPLSKQARLVCSLTEIFSRSLSLTLLAPATLFSVFDPIVSHTGTLTYIELERVCALMYVCVDSEKRKNT